MSENEVSKAKILVVEDNDSIRETMESILAEEGYDVKAAPGVRIAAGLIEKETFNLVISDLPLGADSGLTLVEPVRSKDESTIFLLMTGAGTMETALEAIKKDVDEYILKPIEPAELIHKVKTYLEKQKITKEKEVLVRQLQESNERLIELVKIDELTGAFNRRFLFEQLHIEMQKSRRQRSTLVLMMCDVDGFKKFNDKYGHLEGDTLLKTIVEILKGCVRQYVDMVFRYGGDEFAILVPDANRENAGVIAGRIVSKIRQDLGAKGIGISIGAAAYGDGGMYVSFMNELIHIADTMLYEAKRSGGGKAVV